MESNTHTINADDFRIFCKNRKEAHAIMVGVQCG